MTSRTERRDSEHDDRAECSTPPPSEKNGGERPRGGGVFVEKRTPPIQELESKLHPEIPGSGLQGGGLGSSPDQVHSCDGSQIKDSDKVSGK